MQVVARPQTWLRPCTATLFSEEPSLRQGPLSGCWGGGTLCDTLQSFRESGVSGSLAGTPGWRLGLSPTWHACRGVSPSVAGIASVAGRGHPGLSTRDPGLG